MGGMSLREVCEQWEVWEQWEVCPRGSSERCVLTGAVRGVSLREQ